MEGKRTIESAGNQIAEHAKLGTDFTKHKKAAFIQKRYSSFYSEDKCLQKSNKNLIKSWKPLKNPISPSQYPLFHSA